MELVHSLLLDFPDGRTPEQFLDDIRMDLNGYTDGVTFEFYPGLSGEPARWDTNPLGTIFSIQLVEDVPWLDDGTVVTTGYHATDWTFSTAWSPADWWHPVSGNRRFGVADNGDGTFTFYTRGVDRLSHFTYETTQELLNGLPFAPFTEADNLWQSFQDHIAAEAGGAIIHEPVTNRPEYSQISDVLDGTADVSTLECD